MKVNVTNSFKKLWIHCTFLHGVTDPIYSSCIAQLSSKTFF